MRMIYWWIYELVAYTLNIEIVQRVPVPRLCSRIPLFYSIHSTVGFAVQQHRCSSKISQGYVSPSMILYIQFTNLYVMLNNMYFNLHVGFMLLFVYSWVNTSNLSPEPCQDQSDDHWTLPQPVAAQVPHIQKSKPQLWKRKVCLSHVTVS